MNGHLKNSNLTQWTKVLLNDVDSYLQRQVMGKRVLLQLSSGSSAR